MAKSKKYAFVDKGLCVACGACANECPRAAIAVFRGSYAKADADICVGCALCAKACPVGCISFVEREAAV